MEWLKNKLRDWLGIYNNDCKIRRLNNLYKDLVSIGVDVHFKSPHMILIYSRLKGGQIFEIDAHFDNNKDLMDFVKELKYRFNTSYIHTDIPPQLIGWRKF
jgi:hypothetical protein